jgi:hypothetical protein
MWPVWADYLDSAGRAGGGDETPRRLSAPERGRWIFVLWLARSLPCGLRCVVVAYRVLRGATGVVLA